MTDRPEPAPEPDPEPETAQPAGRPRRRLRALIASAVALAILVPLGWMWWTSLVPDTYSVMDMGVVDLGGGPGEHDHARDGRCRGPGGRRHAHRSATGEADFALTLTAEVAQVQLGGGPVVDGYTLNGSSPGPEIRVTEGDLVEVTLVNDSVPDGVTLHWHGVDVPNAEDGVAGVTQDAVPTGGESCLPVRRGGRRHVLVPLPPGLARAGARRAVRDAWWSSRPTDSAATADADLVAAVHTYDGRRTVNGVVGQSVADAAPGSTVRVRVVNTDAGPLPTWVAGAPYRVVAVDARDLHEPTDVEDTAVLVTAGGRVDLELTMPEDGSPVRIGAGGGATSLLLGDDGGSAPAADVPEGRVDLLSYGTPAEAPFDASAPDRDFEYRIGRRPGFLDGRPGLWWTVNGQLFPDVPMYVVAEGDVVRMTIENTSGEVHPMHLHGHHALVVSRDGVEATGSPWWVDSLNVEDGETYVIAFVADNPGIWMDHCHNLPHVSEGLLAHLMYDGVTTPYVVGGDQDNQPE